MYKFISLIIFFTYSISMFSQENLVYDCKKLGNNQVATNVTQASKPLNYLGKKVYIVKYEIKVGEESIAKFFTYKFKDKLYILDGAITKLNHTTDQVLFDLPHRNYYPIKLTGNMANMELMLEKFYSINDESFYIYKQGQPATTPYEISKFIFDKRLIISEIEIKSKKLICTCTKRKIIIRLK